MKLTTFLATEKTSAMQTSSLFQATVSDHGAIKGIKNQSINKKIKKLGNLSLNDSSQRRKKRKLQLLAIWNIMTIGTAHGKTHGTEAKRPPPGL